MQGTSRPVSTSHNRCAHVLEKEIVTFKRWGKTFLCDGNKITLTLPVHFGLRRYCDLWQTVLAVSFRNNAFIFFVAESSIVEDAYSIPNKIIELIIKLKVVSIVLKINESIDKLYKALNKTRRKQKDLFLLTCNIRWMLVTFWADQPPSSPDTEDVSRSKNEVNRLMKDPSLKKFWFETLFLSKLSNNTNESSTTTPVTTKY